MKSILSILPIFHLENPEFLYYLNLWSPWNFRFSHMKQEDRLGKLCFLEQCLPIASYFSLGSCSVQSLSCVQLFATPWTAAHQASLSITNSWSPPKPMSIDSMMPSNHLLLCRALLLLPSIFPSIRVFSNESALCIRWPSLGQFTSIRSWAFLISQHSGNKAVMKWLTRGSSHNFWPQNIAECFFFCQSKRKM